MLLTLKTKNRKIGDIAATYLPIKQTCPKSCALRDKGCYAQTSYVGMHVLRLQKRFNGYSAYDLIRLEAKEIKRNAPFSEGRILRLHVSGDVRTARMAELLGEAAEEWKSKVYTYTHSWRTIPRAAWGSKISVLASIEKLDQANEAFDKGYAAAVTVAFHPEDGKAFYQNNIKVIPCPQQTKNVTCDKCRLCMNDSMLFQQNAVISFALHGVRKKKALTVIQ